MKYLNLPKFDYVKLHKKGSFPFAALVTVTEEILNGKLHFFSSVKQLTSDIIFQTKLFLICFYLLW